MEGEGQGSLVGDIEGEDQGSLVGDIEGEGQGHYWETWRVDRGHC